MATQSETQPDSSKTSLHLATTPPTKNQYQLGPCHVAVDGICMLRCDLSLYRFRMGFDHMVTIQPDLSSKNGSKCIETRRCRRDQNEAFV